MNGAPSRKNDDSWVARALTQLSTSASGAPVAYSANVSDNFSLASVSYSKNSGSTFALGATTVTITATDSTAAG